MKFFIGLFIILVLMTSPLVIASSKDKEELDRKYLVDIPEPTQENLRWFLIADNWGNAEEYIAKGKYLSLAVGVEDEVNGLIDRLSWNVYETKDFSKDWAYSFSALNIKFLNGHQCDDFPFSIEAPKVNKYLECDFLSCTQTRRNSQDVHELKPKISETWSELDKKGRYKGQCPLKMNFIIGGIGSNNGLNFGYKIVDFNKYFAEILINDESFFLNLDRCKKNKKLCDLVDITLSNFEKDWIRLKKHQEKKDIPELNDLIKHLLPCVKSRNDKCVRSYFVSENDFVKPDQEGLHPGRGALPYYFRDTFELNEEAYKELEACLSYEKLLPHLYGTRGINQVCVFNKHLDLIKGPPKGKTKLITLTYPEGVRELETIDIYKKVEEK